MRERAFTVVGGMLMSVVMQAMFISLITKTMMDLSSVFKEQVARRRRVNDFLSMHSLPVGIVRAIKMQARDYQDVSKQLDKERFVLSLLPEHLKVALLYAARQPFLRMHPLFLSITEKYAPAARHLSGNVFVQRFAVSCETIFDRGNPCQEMRFMATGRTTYGPLDELEGVEGMQTTEVQLLQADEILPNKKLVYGDWISEIAIWAVWTNLQRLRADQNCSLIEVDALRLAETLAPHDHACATATLYAKAFVASIADTGLSDIVSIEVVVDNGHASRVVDEDAT